MTQFFDFTNKVVVITGAGGVICGELAKSFGKQGAKVALLDLNEEAAQKFADEIIAEGGIAKAYKTNVLEKESLEAVREAVNNDLCIQLKLFRYIITNASLCTRYGWERRSEHHQYF